MKILILSAYDKTYADCKLGLLSEEKNKEYANKYGYDFICDKIRNNDIHYFFYKFISILKYLNQYDYIFWIDADAFFTNFSKPIESFIQSPEKTFIATIDKTYLNTGVFIVKNCNEIKELFNKVLTEGPHLNHPFPDAKILFDYYNTIESTWDVSIPQYLLNSYKYELYNTTYPEGEFKPNESLVLHFPGMSYEDRVKAYYKYNVKNLK